MYDVSLLSLLISFPGGGEEVVAGLAVRRTPQGPAVRDLHSHNVTLRIQTRMSALRHLLTLGSHRMNAVWSGNAIIYKVGSPILIRLTLMVEYNYIILLEVFHDVNCKWCISLMKSAYQSDVNRQTWNYLFIASKFCAIIIFPNFISIYPCAIATTGLTLGLVTWWCLLQVTLSTNVDPINP